MLKLDWNTYLRRIFKLDAVRCCEDVVFINHWSTAWKPVIPWVQEIILLHLRTEIFQLTNYSLLSLEIHTGARFPESSCSEIMQMLLNRIPDFKMSAIESKGKQARGSIRQSVASRQVSCRTSLPSNRAEVKNSSHVSNKIRK